MNCRYLNFTQRNQVQRDSEEIIELLPEGVMNCEDTNGGNAEPREGSCGELQRTQEACRKF